MNSNITPKCGVCGQWLLEKHDWNGALWWEHEKPCVPIPEVTVFEIDCQLCAKEFTPKRFTDRLCPECKASRRRARIQKADRAYYARQITAAEQARRRAILEQPRSCLQCGQSFKPKNVRANKQFLCSKKCQWARHYGKKKAA